LGKMSNQDLEKGTRMRLDFLDNEILK
jgi:hypothetical protein